MTERWRRSLELLDRTDPDIDTLRAKADLIELARERPTEPNLERKSGGAVPTIAFSLLLTAGLIYGAFEVVSARRDSAPGGPKPPTNGEVLYTKRMPTGWHLFALDLATGTERQITDGFRDYGSDWSPDGSQVVFDTETRDGEGGIWVANADGTGAVQLTEEGRVPTWSPDGTQIAFARADDETTVSLKGGAVLTNASFIYVMNADGSNVRELTDGATSDYDPAWSPDGSQIVFRRSVEDGGGLYVMKTDGSGQRRVLGERFEVFSFDWSPDGASFIIAVAPTNGGPPGGIMVMAADGSGAPTILAGTETDYPDYIGNVTWSPDGRWLVYTGSPGDGISFMTVDGSDRYSVPVDPGTDTIEELSWAVGTG